jgi:hypothetical protein
MATNLSVKMPQGNDCPNAIPAEVQGEPTACKSHLAGLQAQERLGTQAGHRVANDLPSWKVERLPAERLHPPGGRDLRRAFRRHAETPGRDAGTERRSGHANDIK